jgi:hypothetical protein
VKATEAAKTAGKSLVLASDHTGQVQEELQEELDHALQASLVPRKNADDHLGSRLDKLLDYAEGKAAFRKLDKRYHFQTFRGRIRSAYGDYSRRG